MAFFLGLLIVAKKKKRNYDYVLSIWLYLISIHIAVFSFQEMEFNIPLNWYLMNATIPLAQGVFLYLYTGLLLQTIRIKLILILHFLPLLIFAIGLSIFGEELIIPLIVSVMVSGSIYITLTIKMLGGFETFFRRNNHWLKILTSGLGVVWSIFIVIGILNHLFSYSPISHEYLFLSVNFFVFAIGFFGLKEGHILQEPQTKGRYSSSPLDSTDFAKIKILLNKLTQKKKFFLDSNLKISDLALQIEIPTHHLSQYFNSSLDTTYYDYINCLRIDELKRKIVKNELVTLSILGLAYDCGFNSKATFNRAFKKQNGQTPTEYIRSIK